jgi:outer membrane protein
MKNLAAYFLSTFIAASVLGADAPVADLPDLNLDRPDGIRLTLEDCVRTAIREATSVIKAQNAYEITGTALLQGYAQFLPNLTGSVSTNFNNGTVYYTTATPTLVSGSGQTAAYSLSADLNLFNGLSDITNLKSALLKKDAADLTLFRAKQAIALDITQSFLNVLLDDRLVEIARKNLQESQAHENLLNEQTRVGSKNLADLFRQQAQTSTDESLLLNSENKKRTDQITLLQKLRADVTKSYHFVDFAVASEDVDKRYGNENDLLALGLANRADLKASDETAQASHWDARNQWGVYLPRLDLIGTLSSGGGYLYNQTVAGVNVVPPTQTPAFSQWGNQVEGAVGIVLSWTIFDRFVNRLAVEKADVTELNAKIDAQDFRNQVRADVRLAYSNYKTAAQQLVSSKKGLAAALKAYEVIEGRYEVGAANFLDLVTAQAVLLQSESARVLALTNFKLQGKTMEFALGSINVQ